MSAEQERRIVELEALVGAQSAILESDGKLLEVLLPVLAAARPLARLWREPGFAAAAALVEAVEAAAAAGLDGL